MTDQKPRKTSDNAMGRGLNIIFTALVLATAFTIAAVVGAGLFAVARFVWVELVL
jgi:hypothetical protein